MIFVLIVESLASEVTTSKVTEALDLWAINPRADLNQPIKKTPSD
jgi:hypothetical protein